MFMPIPIKKKNKNNNTISHSIIPNMFVIKYAQTHKTYIYC